MNGQIPLYDGVKLPRIALGRKPSLDVLETTVHIPQTDITQWKDLSGSDRQLVAFAESHCPPADRREIKHRHGHWQDQRIRIENALKRCNIPEPVQWAFHNCGAAAVVEHSPTEHRLRVRAYHCHHRFCLPCAQRRANAVAADIAERLKGHEARFVTLTQRHTNEPLSKQIDQLLKSFHNLRKLRLWKACVKAGVYVLEIKRSENGHYWHPHLHCIVIGGRIPQRDLSAQWAKVNPGSFIVDVRKVRDDKHATRYLTKYATKPFDPSIFRSPHRLDECILSLRGRRMFSVFGQWYKGNMGVEDTSVGDWRRVGRLIDIIDAADNGEQWARGIMLWLSDRRDRPAEADLGVLPAADPAG